MLQPPAVGCTAFLSLILGLGQCAVLCGLSDDCDDNGRPDVVEIMEDPALDCNGNGMLDGCELLDAGPYVREQSSPGAATVGLLHLAPLTGSSRLDILVEGSPWQILRNMGDGTFVPAGDPFGSLGPSGRIVGLADVDGDGSHDVVSVTRSIVVDKGDGFGGFTRRKASADASSPALFGAVGDFEGDGDVDVVACARLNLGGMFQTEVRAYRNDGSGLFEPAGVWVLPVESFAGRVLDFDLDGTNDIVVAGHVLRGAGDGSFRPPLRFEAGAHGSFVPMQDFNGDGLLDWATSNWSRATVSITLQHNPMDLASPFEIGTVASCDGLLMGDVDADGDADLVGCGISARLCVLRNQGSAVFTLQGVYGASTREPYGALLDADEDADLDIVLHRKDARLLTVENLGAGELLAPAVIAQTSRSQDRPLLLNAGGTERPDLLTQDLGRMYSFSVLFDPRAGQLALAPEVAVRVDFTASAAMDLDRDEIDEVILGASPSVDQFMLKIYRFAVGQATTVTIVPLQGYPHALAPIPTEPGRLPRLAVASMNRVFIVEFDSSLSEPAIESISLTGIWKDVSVADFNDDGRPDLALCSVAGTVAVLLANDVGFSPPLSLQLPLPPGQGVLDFTAMAATPGEGAHLLVVLERVTSILRIGLDAGEALSVVDTIDVSPEVTSAIEADIDGDGRPDLVITEGQTLQWRRRSDDNRYESPESILNGANPGKVLPTDFDRDGRIDMVVSESEGLLLMEHLGIHRPTAQDCNRNGQPDECDILTGYVVDEDIDGIPDICELQHSLFQRGDVNADSECDISDTLRLLMMLFAGGSVTCLEAADIDNDGQIDVTDPISLLRYLFQGSRPPSPPGPPPAACGSDTDLRWSRGDLGCLSSSTCDP